MHLVLQSQEACETIRTKQCFGVPRTAHGFAQRAHGEFSEVPIGRNKAHVVLRFCFYFVLLICRFVHCVMVAWYA